MKPTKIMIPILIALALIAIFASCKKSADQKKADAEANATAVNDWESFKPLPMPKLLQMTR